MAFALGATGTYIVFWPALGFTADRLLVQGMAVTVTYGPVLLLLVLLAGRRWGLREGAARAMNRVLPADAPQRAAAPPARDREAGAHDGRGADPRSSRRLL